MHDIKWKNMEKEKECTICECSRCFITWAQILEKEKSDKILCEFCQKNLEMTSKQLLLRRISVLEKTYASRFPELIKHLILHLKLKDI